MTLIQDPNAPLEDRCSAIILAGREGDFDALPHIKALAADLSEIPELREQAILGLCHYPTHDTFPSLVRLFNDPSVLYSLVDHLPVLADRRVLFPLAAAYLRQDDSDAGMLIKNKILQTMKLMGDCRAGSVLSHLPIEPAQYVLRDEIRQRCIERPYSFCGPERLRRAARRTGVRITGLKALQDCRAFLGEEQGIGAYVVLEGPELLLGPRRSEHYQIAGGADVLTAGELMSDGRRVLEISNHSGGYVPSERSFRFADVALSEAGIDHPAALTRRWPAEGYTRAFIEEYARPDRY